MAWTNIGVSKTSVGSFRRLTDSISASFFRRPLTQIAQEHWAGLLSPGAWVMDATAGNGHDTTFLARMVGPGGRVYAVDCQEEALVKVSKGLQVAELKTPVFLCHGDHAELDQLLPTEARGKLKLAVFNLGYLPGGDPSITTQAASTVKALNRLLDWLAPDGALSVMAYRGHPGGMEEAASVETFFQTLPTPWRCTLHLASGHEANPGPVLWLATAKAEGG